MFSVTANLDNLMAESVLHFDVSKGGKEFQTFAPRMSKSAVPNLVHLVFSHWIKGSLWE